MVQLYSNGVPAQDRKVPAPAVSRVPNPDTAGAVGISQVARRAGAAFGRFPPANIGLLSVAPGSSLARPPAQAGKRPVPGPGYCTCSLRSMERSWSGANVVSIVLTALRLSLKGGCSKPPDGPLCDSRFRENRSSRRPPPTSPGIPAGPSHPGKSPARDTPHPDTGCESAWPWSGQVTAPEPRQSCPVGHFSSPAQG